MLLRPCTMWLARTISIVILLICLGMLYPLGKAVLALSAGTPVPTAKWAAPMIIRATGAVMTWLLTRKSVSLQLYMAAFALWVVTAGYCFSLMR